MKFIAGGLNGNYLREIQMKSYDHTESIKAAIAFASGDPELFKDCLSYNIKITFWGRYDETVPVSLPILKKFLDKKSPNFVCKLVPDIFHAKIIWWEGYGVYIGSANLTNRGWYENIEAGVFLSEEEIIENDLPNELNNFFDELDQKSVLLSLETYNELCELQKNNHELDKRKKHIQNIISKKRTIPFQNPLNYITKSSSLEKRHESFLLEWMETLQILRDIADRVSKEENRPLWVKHEVPQGVQADQFLHAFYYSNVKDGNKSCHVEFFQKNKNNPDKALKEALKWWKSREEAPHSEDEIMYEWALYLKEMLDKEKILSLSVDEFIEVCGRVHALRDHSLRVNHTTYGFSAPLPKMDQSARIKLLGEWLYKQKSLQGRSVLESLYYMLYEGEMDAIPERIWKVAETDHWKISHLGISSLGEIVGWALPNKFPPRNGRTSKTLTALGYKVRIHSM